MPTLDLTGDTCDLVASSGDLKLITVNTGVASAAGDVWEALVRPRADSGEFVAWTVSTVGAGTAPYPVVIEADFGGLEPGLWVWGLFRNGLPFWQLSTVTVLPALDGSGS